MKKLWLLVAMAALTGAAVQTYADVQNIRISGDIRIRGYYLADVDPDDDPGEDSFISQRTRISVEADLEDHVLVVVTLKAEGLWGDANSTVKTSGAGLEENTDPQAPRSVDSEDSINRDWDLGVTEAYVQFSEMFYSPATLKLGRQYLHYGRGLIISNVEQEYNFDAARLVLDYYPLTIDLLYSAAVENTDFGAGDGERDAEMFFVNARYELSDSIIKAIEGYFGYLSNHDSTFSRVPPSTGALGEPLSPLLVGARIDINPLDVLEMWAEGAYEFGDGTGRNTLTSVDSIDAWLAQAGLKFHLKDVSMTPVLNAQYTYASGGGSSGEKGFVPWFDYQEGYNGYLFSPMLSNLHIINVGGSISPRENTTLSVQGYYYMRVDRDGPAGSSSNIDNGGYGESLAVGSGGNEIGWEIDTILTYDYSKDVRLQLVYAAFIPGDGLGEDTDYSSSVAHEVRAEANVRF